MPRMEKWRSYHIRVRTLEKVCGVKFLSLRAMLKSCEDEDISIRLPRERWSHYGIEEDAIKELGLENQTVIYVNL